MKSPQTRASRLSMRRIMAAYTNASPLAHRNLSKSLLILLLWLIQENVRSTTHLLGKTWKPSGGSSFCQSTATPSLAHSLAHAIRAPLWEQAFGDAPRDQRSTLTSFLPSPCPCPLRGSPRVQPQMTEAGKQS